MLDFLPKLLLWLSVIRYNLQLVYANNTQAFTLLLTRSIAFYKLYK